MAATDLVRPPGDAGPVGAAAARVPLRAARPGPVLRRAGRGHRGDGHRSVAGGARRRAGRAAPCSTSAAARAISPPPSRDAGLRLHRRRARPAEMHAGPRRNDGTATYVRASGTALPFADASVDICLSSNVAEHVPQPWRLGREMLRVTKPGGLVMLSYTVWLGPFGGHEMGLYALPRRRPRRRRATPASTAIRRRTTTDRHCSRCRPPTGWMGGQHRRAARRISPLPPTMGVVDDDGAAAEGVPGEQSGAGPAAAASAGLKPVLVLPDRG